eukprot:1160901-Pelagomonas_calceolata.AAC.3
MGPAFAMGSQGRENEQHSRQPLWVTGVGVGGLMVCRWACKGGDVGDEGVVFWGYQCRDGSGLSGLMVWGSGQWGFKQVLYLPASPLVPCYAPVGSRFERGGHQRASLTQVVALGLFAADSL